jgi:hypothetical protein
MPKMSDSVPPAAVELFKRWLTGDDETELHRALGLRCGI